MMRDADLLRRVLTVHAVQCLLSRTDVSMGMNLLLLMLFVLSLRCEVCSQHVRHRGTVSISLVSILLKTNRLTSQSPLDFHVFIFHVSGISWRVSVCVTIKRCNWLILGNVLHWPQYILYAFGNPPCKRHIEMFSSISYDVFLKMTLNAFFVCLPSRFSKREEEEGKDERIDFHP